MENLRTTQSEYKTTNTFSNKKLVVNKSYEGKQAIISITSNEFLKEFYKYKKDQDNIIKKTRTRKSLASVRSQPFAMKTCSTFSGYKKLKEELNTNNGRVFTEQNEDYVNPLPRKHSKHQALFLKKNKLIENIKQLKKEKKELKCLYDEWIISQRTISKLEKDINKYESLTNNCKQTYLNLSEEYKNLKIALSKVHKSSNK